MIINNEDIFVFTMSSVTLFVEQSPTAFLSQGIFQAISVSIWKEEFKRGPAPEQEYVSTKWPL